LDASRLPTTKTQEKVFRVAWYWNLRNENPLLLQEYYWYYYFFYFSFCQNKGILTLRISFFGSICQKSYTVLVTYTHGFESPTTQQATMQLQQQQQQPSW
tara:strand:- start:444 stop:743 length:300 start_codon:yes stop_codon:yes gene_type:complete